MFKVCLRFWTKDRYRYLFTKYIDLSYCVNIYPGFLENWNEKSIRKSMWHGWAGFAWRSYWILWYGSVHVVFSTKYVHVLVIESNQDYSLVSKLLTLQTEIKSFHAQKKWRGKGFVFQDTFVCFLETQIFEDMVFDSAGWAQSMSWWK